MSKKYYDLEEAAALLGMPKDELNRLREQGKIRGFADRGTWKFRDEDIDKLKRSRQIDSDPDVPMAIDESSSEMPVSPSVLADDEGLAEQPTIVSKRDAMSGSDSDVRLAVDSDSDVKLIGEEDSDSDVKLVGQGDSDSDVKLVGGEGKGKPGDLESTQPIMPQVKKKADTDSDSDVRLVDSDSDVRLASDEDVSILAGEDSQIALDFTPDDSESASVLSEESGLALGDSSMLLAGESGISLEGPGDSGALSLADDEEGITIAPDSGVALNKSDSDITLDTGSDSGISLEEVNDSGISLDDSIEVGAGTIAMMDVSGEEGVAETQFEIPVGKDDSAFELGIDDNEKTGVLNLDDSGESTLDDAVFELDEAESDDMFESADELEVADEVLGEDDELDELDVFDADDDVFGESGPQFAAPVAAGGPYVEATWGTGTIIGLGVSSICMLLLGIIMFDLVRLMWQPGDTSTVGGALLGAFRGLYGGSGP